MAIATVCCVVSYVLGGYADNVGPFGALFALCSLAYTTTRRDTLLVGVPAGVALLAGFVAGPVPLSPSNVGSNLLVIAFALLVGDLLRARRH